MDRPNPCSRSFATWTSPVMPTTTLLHSTFGRGSNPHVNEEVTMTYRDNLESRMQNHVLVVYREVKLDNVQIDSYNFTPDEELLDLDLDANSLSRRATSSSSSLSVVVHDHCSEPPCSISIPTPQVVTSVLVTKPVGVTSKVAAPSTQEVVPYIE